MELNQLFYLLQNDRIVITCMDNIQSKNLLSENKPWYWYCSFGFKF